MVGWGNASGYIDRVTCLVGSVPRPFSNRAFVSLAELEQMGLRVVKPSPPELWEESGTLVAWPVKVPIDIGAAPQSPNAGDDNHLDGEDDVGPF